MADELYALLPGEFVARRDRVAADLKGRDAALARRVRALTKPTTAAWVVNQLVRAEAEQVEQVLGVGEALRVAQRSMSADELRALTRQRRQLTAAVTQHARGLARERGVGVSDEIADRVEATLTAAVLDAGCARAVRSGMLVSALRSTGVEASDVAAALAAPDALGFVATPHSQDGARPPLRAVPGPAGDADRDADDLDEADEPDEEARRDEQAAAEARARALAAAQEELDEAERVLAGAARTHEDAGSALGDLDAQALQIESELAELRLRVAELEVTGEDLEEDREVVEAEEQEAARALADAAQTRDAALARLARLAETGGA